MPSIIERLWRSLKDECVHLDAFETGSEPGGEHQENRLQSGFEAPSRRLGHGARNPGAPQRQPRKRERSRRQRQTQPERAKAPSARRRQPRPRSVPIRRGPILPRSGRVTISGWPKSRFPPSSWTCSLISVWPSTRPVWCITRPGTFASRAVIRAARRL